MKKIIALTLTMVVGSIAMADQCAYISKDKAEKAVQALIQTQSVQSLCEPCGETKVTSVTTTAIGYKKVDYKNFYAVTINDKEIDLAYTYVNGLNLAKLVGCPTTGVTAAINVK